jgi:hypothetical protein
MKIAIGAVLPAFILCLGCGSDSSGNDVADVVDVVEATDDGQDVPEASEEGVGTDADADVDGDADVDRDAGADADTDHVVISEVAVAPAGGEFVEIWNRGASAVALDHCYLSDNSAYYGIATGQPWNPVGTPETDFLAQFPAGATIGPNELLVIQAASGDFSSTYGSCPNYVLAAVGVGCGSGTVPPLVVPTNGGSG